MKNILMLAIFVISGCAGCGTGDPKPNITIKDDMRLCEPACTHVQELGCPEGNDLVYPNTCTADTANTCEAGICINGYCTETCVMVCEALVQEGVLLGLECWQNITTCEEIETVCR